MQIAAPLNTNTGVRFRSSQIASKCGMSSR